MSKRLVDLALECASRRDWAGAEKCLETVNLAFIRRRLIAKYQSSPEARQAISALWDRMLPGEAPAPLATPVSRADRGSAPNASATRAVRRVVAPELITIEEPGEFLGLLEGREDLTVSFKRTKVVHIWALSALASMAHREERSVAVEFGHSKAGDFAIAQGLAHHVAGEAYTRRGECGRSFNLANVARFDEIESAATQISKMVVEDSTHGETRRAIYYVLVELLRNAVQHSQDPRGGMVAAQLMDERNRYPTPRVQVVVADQGIGFFESMRGTHPKVTSPAEGVAKALLPFISGTFREGEPGTMQNAGMGLFVISEIAKRTAGTMLLATRGATLMIRGDPEFEGNHQITALKPDGLGFTGSLVAFELPLDGVVDFQDLFEAIKERAKAMHPRTSNTWITYGEATELGPGTTLLVRLFAENTSVANDYSRTKLAKLVERGEPIVLDFKGIEICTQSFVHALLFGPLRMAWKRGVPVTARNAAPGVRSALEMLESYTLVEDL